MILQRALFRESSHNTLGVALILVLLMSFIGFTQILGRVASGKFTLDVVFPVFALRLLGQADTVIPLALFLGVLFTVNRWYRDSEMTVISACGVNLPRLLIPIGILSLLGAFLVGMSSLYAIPWAVKKIDAIESEARNLSMLSGLKPGIFNAIDKKGGVFYIKTINKNAEFTEPFIRIEEDAGDSRRVQNVIKANRGHYKIDPETNVQYLVLEQGYAYTGLQGKSDRRVTTFRKYTVRIEATNKRPLKKRSKSMSTSELFKSKRRREKAELHWRIARPITCFLLTLMAVGLAYGTPRKSAFGNLFGGVVVFFFYNNLLSIGFGLIRSGKVSTTMGLWWVHLLAVMFLTYIIWRRTNYKALFSNPFRVGRYS